MINTLNESSLHKSLKEIYRIKESNAGNILLPEVKVGRYICDLANKTNIVEIQGGNLSALKKKLDFLLTDYRVKVVYPVVRKKHIITVNAQGEVLRKAVSPKKCSIYSIFKEMTKLSEIILHENLEIHGVEVIVQELRLATDEPQQSKNKRRRFMQSWQKVDKKLEETGKTVILDNEGDYLALLGDLLQREKFTLTDLAEVAGKKNAGYMKYVLLKAGLLEEIFGEGRRKNFRVKFGAE